MRQYLEKNFVNTINKYHHIRHSGFSRLIDIVGVSLLTKAGFQAPKLCSI